LETAAAKGNLDLVRRMLDTRENVPAPVMFQTLRAAAQSGNLELVLFLIEKGADVNGSPADAKDFVTVLMAAVQSGKADVVKEILLHRPDVNATGNGGPTSLTTALQRGSDRDYAPTIVESLIAYGANVSQTDEQGRTPLFAACNTPQAVRLLVAAGADVNARDKAGQTPLMNCSYKKDFVAAMLEAGADPSLRDFRGETALDRARRMSSKDAAELIEAALKTK
jgi:ankyrin repeat protein